MVARDLCTPSDEYVTNARQMVTRRRQYEGSRVYASFLLSELLIFLVVSIYERRSLPRGTFRRRVKTKKFPCRSVVGQTAFHISDMIVKYFSGNSASLAFT